MRLYKKALALREIIIAILVLIVLAVIIYIAFGPIFKETVTALFNKTETVAEKTLEKGIGEIFSRFSIK